MLQVLDESALRLVSQFIFHRPRPSKIDAFLVAPALEPRKRKLLSQKESQQTQIGSVCFYAPMGMLSLGRDLIFLAEEAYYF